MSLRTAIRWLCLRCDCRDFRPVWEEDDESRVTAMAIDDRDSTIAQQQATMDDIEAQLASIEAVQTYWRKKAREYRAEARVAQREVRELQAAVTQKAPVSTKADSLITAIHAVLSQSSHSNVPIESLEAQIEEYWREIGQLRP